MARFSIGDTVRYIGGPDTRDECSYPIGLEAEIFDINPGNAYPIQLLDQHECVLESEVEGV